VRALKDMCVPSEGSHRPTLLAACPSDSLCEPHRVLARRAQCKCLALASANSHSLSCTLTLSLREREREPERRRRAATAIPNAERRSRSGSAPALLGFRVCFSFHACLGVPWVAPSPPLLQMLWRSSSSGASLRPTATTFTCARSSSRVTAAPIPVPAPVTTAQRAVAADILCVSANKKKIAPCSPRSSNNKHTHCVLVDYF